MQESTSTKFKPATSSTRVYWKPKRYDIDRQNRNDDNDNDDTANPLQ